MGEVIPFRREMTPAERAHLVDQLVEVEMELGVMYAKLEEKERKREDLRRRLGYLGLERGLRE